MLTGAPLKTIPTSFSAAIAFSNYNVSALTEYIIPTPLWYADNPEIYVQPPLGSCLTPKHARTDAEHSLL